MMSVHERDIGAGFTLDLTTYMADFTTDDRRAADPLDGAFRTIHFKVLARYTLATELAWRAR